MEDFKSTQHAWYIWLFSIAGLIGGLFIVFSSSFPADQKTAVIPLFAFSVLLPLGFSKLESTVTKDKVKIKFGIGVIRKTILISEIEDISSVENKLWYGWGIRITPHGWLWNIKGKEAVQFKIKGKERFFRLGCEDMKAMQKAIIARM